MSLKTSANSPRQSTIAQEAQHWVSSLSPASLARCCARSGKRDPRCARARRVLDKPTRHFDSPLVGLRDDASTNDASLTQRFANSARLPSKKGPRTQSGQFESPATKATSAKIALSAAPATVPSETPKCARNVDSAWRDSVKKNYPART